MLSGPGQFAENETNEVNFREIPSHVLQKVKPFKIQVFYEDHKKADKIYFTWFDVYEVNL